MEQTGLELKERMSYLVARICHAHRNYINTELSKLDLHVGQEMFLLCLSEHEGVMQSELADHLSIQQATVTRMLDRMENAGLVERCKDGADQRVSRVHLTEPGRSLLQPIAQMWREVEAKGRSSLQLTYPGRAGWDW
jgi:DNA-binding MarR family transcriptional regulator